MEYKKKKEEERKKEKEKKKKKVGVRGNKRIFIFEVGRV